MSLPGSKVVLRAEGITKMFPGTVALDQVDFNVYRGKVNVLIGENGAGKSTLVKIIAGVERPTAGRLILDGGAVNFRSTRDADRHGISMIYQELNLCPNLSVAENIFMARERKTGLITIDHRKQRNEAKKLLERLRQAIDPDTLVGNLRLGEQQMVEIAKSLARDARILIMDEPTSALSRAEVDALFDVIRELREQGVSIIYISHKLEELLRIGDVVTVLRDGRLIAEETAAQVDVPWIVERMVGGRLEALFTHSEREAGKETLKVENLSVPRPGGGKLIDSVSFQLRRGEILGIYGLMGAGRTELFETLVGLRHESSGKISLGGEPLRGLSISERLRRGIVLVPEDRQALGLVQTLSVRDNMTLASLRNLASGGYLPERRVDSAVTALIRDLAIKVASPRQPITSLSGGNQQKVVLAKCMMTNPKVLLLDEPTRGIDVGAKAEICELMNRLAAKGLGIILASSELEEVRAIADRVIVLSKGRVTGEFSRPQATGAALASAASTDTAASKGEHRAEA